MAIKTIEYNVNLNETMPATEQFAGTQGDHKVTCIKFALSKELYDSIIAAKSDNSIMCRFDVYDGQGGIWQSEPINLESEICFELEERHTRFGGKIIIYLVVTAISGDGTTEIELYSFPAVLRLKNRPEGIFQTGEDYESVTSLSKNAKTSADNAAQTLEKTKEFALNIEQKLQNGEFDGIGIERVEIIGGEMIVTYTNKKQENIGNVKGEKGDIGPRGEKGEDAVTDLAFNGSSNNAQSGKAVTQAIDTCVKKLGGNGHTDEVYAVGAVSNQKKIEVEDCLYFENGASSFTYCIPRRNANGNLLTHTPISEMECANKKYVDDYITDIGATATSANNGVIRLDKKIDDIVGDIEILLGGI